MSPSRPVAATMMGRFHAGRKDDRGDLHDRFRDPRRLRRRDERASCWGWPRMRCWWTSPTTCPRTTSPRGLLPWRRRPRCSPAARFTWRSWIPEWAPRGRNWWSRPGRSIFVGPDNGLLSLAARGPRVAHQIAAAGFRREPVSPTFHGRDVFAAAAGRLAAGAPPRDAGPLVPAILDLVPAPAEAAGAGGAAVGVILHIDRFGNLITSIEADRCTAGRGNLAAAGREQQGGPTDRTQKLRAARGSDLRGRGQRCPGGVRGQLRADRDRRPRRLGGRGHRPCSRRLGGTGEATR